MDDTETLVICSGAGGKGCDPDCDHAKWHLPHKAKQTQNDGQKACTETEECVEVQLKVRCESQKDA